MLFNIQLGTISQYIIKTSFTKLCIKITLYCTDTRVTSLESVLDKNYYTKPCIISCTESTFRVYDNDYMGTRKCTKFRPVHISSLIAHLINKEYLADGIFTLNVRGRSYLGLTRSISWLLMPWLLTSPGHQQPWYWLYRICRSFSYLSEDFKYLCHINEEKWHKTKIYVISPLKNLERKE